MKNFVGTDVERFRGKEISYAAKDLEQIAMHVVVYSSLCNQKKSRVLIFERDALTKDDPARSSMTILRRVEIHELLHFHIDTNMWPWKACVLT